MREPPKTAPAVCAQCGVQYPRDAVSPGKIPPAFCSERCRIIDLARWMSGGYAIAGQSVEDGDPDSPGDDRS